MSKKKVAIISVLKPTDDIRSFHKISHTLINDLETELFLFGQKPHVSPKETSSIHFFPHQFSSLRVLSRLFIRLKIFRKLITIKPDLVICNTHELLFICVWLKIVLGTKILYDIQENYYLNFTEQNNYATVLGRLLGTFSRLKERLTAPWFDHFILAEKSYKDELLFIEDRYTIVENKALDHLSHCIKKPSPPRILLFTGTLTESNGIYKCLNFMRKMHDVSPNQFSFKIIGHSPSQKTEEVINQIEYQFIETDISSTPIPYSKIKQAIEAASFGLICYSQNRSNIQCMPTKVFEYSSTGLPMLYEANALWSTYIREHQLGIETDFNNPDLSFLIDEMNAFKIDNEFDRSSVLWSSESEKLKKVISELVQ